MHTYSAEAETSLLLSLPLLLIHFVIFDSQIHKRNARHSHSIEHERFTAKVQIRSASFFRYFEKVILSRDYSIRLISITSRQLFLCYRSLFYVFIYYLESTSNNMAIGDHLMVFRTIPTLTGDGLHYALRFSLMIFLGHRLYGNFVKELYLWQ